jgi:hypothetical protein
MTRKTSRAGYAPVASHSASVIPGALTRMLTVPTLTYVAACLIFLTPNEEALGVVKLTALATLALLICKVWLLGKHGFDSPKSCLISLADGPIDRMAATLSGRAYWARMLLGLIVLGGLATAWMKAIISHRLHTGVDCLFATGFIALCLVDMGISTLRFELARTLK